MLLPKKNFVLPALFTAIILPILSVSAASLECPGCPKANTREGGVGSSGGQIPLPRVPKEFQYDCRIDFFEQGPDFKSASTKFSITQATGDVARSGYVDLKLKDLNWGKGRYAEIQSKVDGEHSFTFGVTVQKDGKRLTHGTLQLVYETETAYQTGESTTGYLSAQNLIATEASINSAPKDSAGKPDWTKVMHYSASVSCEKIL